MQQECSLMEEVKARNKRAHHSLLSKLPNLLDRPGGSLLETHAVDLVPTFALVFRPMPRASEAIAGLHKTNVMLCVLVLYVRACAGGSCTRGLPRRRWQSGRRRIWRGGRPWICLLALLGGFISYLMRGGRYLKLTECVEVAVVVKSARWIFRDEGGGVLVDVELGFSGVM